MSKYKTNRVYKLTHVIFNEDDFSYHDKLTPNSFLQEHNEVTTFPDFDKWIPKLVKAKIPNAAIEGPQELHANQNILMGP